MDNQKTRPDRLPLDGSPIDGNHDVARFRIDREGQWYHDGGLIRRPAMVALFATILKRESDGRYWLVTPVERALVEVEDAPFMIVSFTTSDTDSDCFVFETNVGSEVSLTDPNQLSLRETIPYLAMAKGLSGRLTRSCYAALSEHIVETSKGFAVQVGDQLYEFSEVAA